MAREIKYRVWNPRYKDFSYWGFLDRGFCGIPTGAGMNIQECFEASEQFIGIKDKNGKDIYEGDTLKCGEAIATVEWEDMIDQDFYWGNATGFIFNFDPDLMGGAREFEIIGNIHENPPPPPAQARSIK